MDHRQKMGRWELQQLSHCVVSAMASASVQCLGPGSHMASCFIHTKKRSVWLIFIVGPLRAEQSTMLHTEHCNSGTGLAAGTNMVLVTWLRQQRSWEGAGAFHQSMAQSCNEDSSKLLGKGHWYWIHDFVATIGVNDRPIYMTLCSWLVWGGPLDTRSRPSVVIQVPNL